MVDPNATSPLDTASGAAGPHAADTFALLANETRLSILLALWEEYDPHEADNAVPFSVVFDRLEERDRGNVSYHIKELQGQFVRQRVERGGYELRETGLKLVRAIIAGAGVQNATLERTEIDRECPFCDAPTAVRYHDGVLVHSCTECDGVGPAGTDTEGFLSAVPFDPAGLAARTPEEIRAAATVAAHRQVRSLFEGLCPACSGPVQRWLECCADHDPDGTCDRCGRKFAAWARFRCRVCKNHSTTSPKSLALFDPAVVSFYDDHGISTRIRADDVARVEQVFDLIDEHEMDLVSRDPPRVEVTVRCDDDSLQVTFDEDVNVIDARR